MRIRVMRGRVMRGLPVFTPNHPLFVISFFSNILLQIVAKISEVISVKINLLIMYRTNETMEHVKAKTTRILPVVVFPLMRSSAQFCILKKKSMH